MKKQQQALEKLERIIAPDLPNLERILINKEGNSYQAFGRYRITPENDLFAVYRGNSFIGLFSSTKTAISWCIADKYSKNSLANDIVRLEEQKILLDADLKVRGGIAKKISNSERREFVMTKIVHRREKLKHIENRLTKCVDLAKYWQIKGFTNETARTGRPASHRTNR